MGSKQRVSPPTLPSLREKGPAVSARRELHLSEGVAVRGDEDAGVTRTPRGQPCRRRRSGWRSGSGPCVMKRLLVDRRADYPRHVLNVVLLCFMALGGLVPAREGPAPPSELPIDQERSALTRSAGLSGRARPADTLRGRAPCAGRASPPAAGRAAGVEAAPHLHPAPKPCVQGSPAPPAPAGPAGRR